MTRRSIAAAVLALGLLAGCGGGSEPREAGPLATDAFDGEAPRVDGSGTVELSAFADQDLVVWFWSPW